MAVDADEIARLLRESRAAHSRALTARQMGAPDRTELLIDAKVLRVLAHDLDPEHTAPAWAEEAADRKVPTHAAFMEFYQRKVPAA